MSGSMTEDTSYFLHRLESLVSPQDPGQWPSEKENVLAEVERLGRDRWLRAAEVCFMAELGGNPKDGLLAHAQELLRSKGESKDWPTDEQCWPFYEGIRCFYGLVLVGVARKDWTAVDSLARDFFAVTKRRAFVDAWQLVYGDDWDSPIWREFSNLVDYFQIVHSIQLWQEKANNLPTEGQKAVLREQLRQRLGTFLHLLLVREEDDLVEAEWMHQKYLDSNELSLQRPMANSLCVAVESVLERTLFRRMIDRFGMPSPPGNSTVLGYLSEKFAPRNTQTAIFRGLLRELYPEADKYLLEKFPKELSWFKKVRNKAAHGGEGVSARELTELRTLLFGTEGFEGMLVRILSLREVA